MISDSGGAELISWQLAMYRTLDNLEAARRHRDLAGENAFLSQEANRLLGLYNDLVGKYNRLAESARGTANENAQLREQLDSAATERARQAKHIDVLQQQLIGADIQRGALILGQEEDEARIESLEKELKVLRGDKDEDDPDSFDTD